MRPAFRLVAARRAIGGILLAALALTGCAQGPQRGRGAEAAPSTASSADTGPLGTLQDGQFDEAFNNVSSPPRTSADVPAHDPVAGPPTARAAAIIPVPGQQAEQQFNGPTTPAAAATRTALLYSPDNPSVAMLNVLADLGYSWTNPLVQKTLIPKAEGLAQAYKIEAALTPGYMANGGDIPSDYQAWLKKVISSGQVNQVMSHAYQRLPEVAQLYRDNAGRQGTGGKTLNPAAAALIDQLGGPQATSEGLSRVRSPLVGALYGQQAARGSDMLAQVAEQRAVRNGSGGEDLFKLLWGVPVAGSG